MDYPKMAFTPREAALALGLRVRLAQRFHKWPVGTRGKVVNRHPYQTGYLVEVEWEDLLPASHMNFEYFTKDEFVHYLDEC